jgi:electron transfer flavoprotein alpha subunit
MSGGLREDSCCETVVFYRDERDREHLVALAPTCDVRLVKTAARCPDCIVASLGASAGTGDTSMYLFAAGATGTELATRLACRTGGSLLTDALSIEAQPDRILGRRNVYSNHMVARFELSARPCCISIDASWNDAGSRPVLEHRVMSDTDETANACPDPFEALEIAELPSTGDLAASRFVVVAGRGAGSRAAVDRIASAAARMGAAFGVSRPVAMNAWAPMDRLVGVSGTRTAPDLCLVVGASGAPALHWGIERAAFIVAVNPDDCAPIVGNADAAVLDDGVAVIEELAEIIAQERGGA